MPALVLLTGMLVSNVLRNYAAFQVFLPLQDLTEARGIDLHPLTEA